MGVEIRSAVFSFLSWEDDKLKEEPESHSSFPSHDTLDVFDQMCVCSEEEKYVSKHSAWESFLTV